MTEKRSDYRKRQSRHKSSNFLSRVKSAFDDEQENEEVDVNPAFQRDESERRSFQDDGQPTLHSNNFDVQTPHENKALKLKKRLNRAILIVFVLIILVLLALFHL